MLARLVAQGDLGTPQLGGLEALSAEAQPGHARGSVTSTGRREPLQDLDGTILTQ